MMRIISIIFIILLAILGITFAILNGETVTIKYYFGEKNLPLSFALILSFVIGIVFGVVSNLVTLIKTKMEVRTLKKTIETDKAELSRLRVLTFDDKKEE